MNTFGLIYTLGSPVAFVILLYVLGYLFTDGKKLPITDYDLIGLPASAFMLTLVWPLIIPTIIIMTVGYFIISYFELSLKKFYKTLGFEFSEWE